MILSYCEDAQRSCTSAARSGSINARRPCNAEQTCCDVIPKAPRKSVPARFAPSISAPRTTAPARNAPRRRRGAGGQTGRFLVFVDKICAFTFQPSTVDCQSLWGRLRSFFLLSIFLFSKFREFQTGACRAAMPRGVSRGGLKTQRAEAVPIHAHALFRNPFADQPRGNRRK